MEWLILIPVCLLGGWWLFSTQLGGSGEAQDAMKENPARGFLGIVFFGVVVLVVLFIIGSLTGG
jgi:hypothetical protein